MTYCTSTTSSSSTSMTSCTSTTSSTRSCTPWKSLLLLSLPTREVLMESILCWRREEPPRTCSTLILTWPESTKVSLDGALAVGRRGVEEREGRGRGEGSDRGLPLPPASLLHTLLSWGQRSTCGWNWVALAAQEQRRGSNTCSSLAVTSRSTTSSSSTE